MSTHHRIWIDIKNSHEPLLFKSLLSELPYEFYITARDYAEVIDLLDKYELKYRKVGHYHTKNKIAKSFYLLVRSLHLSFLVPQFDYFLSHGSVYGILASKIRNRKVITITDNDFYTIINKVVTYAKSDFLIIPHFLEWKKFKTKNVIAFNGFKEDIYIADFKEEKCEKEIPYENYILIRPEAFKTYYVDSSIPTIVPYLLQLFSEEGFKIVLLPRYPEERQKYSKFKNVFIPPKPINGLCGVWHARAVLTGAGTLAREAACMGVPAVSFFPGKELLSVDKEMIRRGWMHHSRNPQSIVKYVVNAERRERSIERSKKVKMEVVNIIREIVEGER